MEPGGARLAAETDELNAAMRVSGARPDVLIAVVCCSVHIAETHYIVQMSNFRCALRLSKLAALRKLLHPVIVNITS